MGAISELFDRTVLVVPCYREAASAGTTDIIGRNIEILPLSVPAGKGLARKLLFPVWLIKNALKIFTEIWRADAVHAVIPGDVGTIGMAAALIMRKPLFVRHCGNWWVHATTSERLWRWAMERFAGGRNVMFATGGSDGLPSARNLHIEWIFSTSLSRDAIQHGSARSLNQPRSMKLITACRLEEKKGVETVIRCLPLLLEQFPDATLSIVGDGTLRPSLERTVQSLGLRDRVHFHGRVSQTAVMNLMRSSDVFCFPTSASEGFPKVVLEALSCGLPIVTTKVSVLPHLLKDECGSLLNEPTPEALEEAIRAIAGDPERYRNMSSAALAVAAKYSLEDWRELIGERLRRAWNVNSLASQP
jgi:glycosyltransferase involved in cell wall biosynthesis